MFVLSLSRRAQAVEMFVFFRRCRLIWSTNDGSLWVRKFWLSDFFVRAQGCDGEVVRVQTPDVGGLPDVGA